MKKKKARISAEIYEDSKNVLKEAAQNERFEGRYQRVLRHILDKVTSDKVLLQKLS